VRKTVLFAAAGSIVTVFVQPFAARAADPAVRAAAECHVPGKGYTPFSAGRDRCWEPINGRSITPKRVGACAVKRSDGSLSVTFMFAETDTPECDNRHVASREEWTRALPLLGDKERALVTQRLGAK
jgi:hypothetical protein